MTIQQDREELLKQHRENNEAHAFYQFFRKLENQSLYCKANEQLIREHHNGTEITEASIEEVVGYLGDKLARKSDEHVRADQQAQKEADQIQQQSNRAGLEQMILEMLPEQSRAFESARMKYRTDDQLRARLSELHKKIRMASMTSSELREYIQELQAAATPTEPLVEINLDRSTIMKWSGSQMRAYIYDSAGRQKPGRDKNGRTIREQITAIINGN